ncbi:MAG: TrkH family potassium uptake protein [Fervidobacterium sp.]|nr:TrkH family potassium uptake protein [Fervidobacterium sp.]
MYNRYIKIFKAFSIIMIQYSFIALFPIIFCVFYPEELKHIYGFILTATISLSIYLIGYLVKIEDVGTINYKDGALLTIFTWIMVALLSAIPHMVEGRLNFSQAVFESVSGLTTTGLTMYTDVTKVSKLVLFWRSLTQYIGGAGFALLMLSMVIGPKGVGFYKAEGRADNLVPNLRRSTQIILQIYLAYTAFGTLALTLAGMNWFEALNHTMTALATGGFSTRNGSIGEFNSLAIEIIIIVLMYLGATGFAIHYAFWKGNWKSVLKNGEPWLMTSSIAIFSTVVAFNGVGKYFKDFLSGLRYSLFQITSAISGTGFQTLPLNEKKWLSFSPLMLSLIVLMIAGGQMDSTSGGVKQFRIWIILNTLSESVKGFLLPKSRVKTHVLYKGEQQLVLTSENIKEALLILFLYILSFIIGSFILTLHGYDLQRSMFEFASAMDGVGLSSGVTSPDMPLSAMWTLTLGMFTGRFEFLIIIYAFSRVFDDLRNKLKSWTLKKSKRLTREELN